MHFVHDAGNNNVG